MKLQTRILSVTLSLLALGSTQASAVIDRHSGHDHSQGCRMFPENDLYYPIRDGLEETGITQNDFNQILDAVEMVYMPEVRALGARLKILRDWESGEVNAGASRSPLGNTYLLHMYGGMARHPQMTKEGFLLVACHEIGHHLGLSPTYPGTPMASEGQADYYATLKCMRRVLNVFNTAKDTARLARMSDRLATKVCDRFHSINLDGTNDAMAVCLRSHQGAETPAKVLAELTNKKRVQKRLPPLPIPKLGTPDTSSVKRTIIDSYPGIQCRLDTYSAGALCPVSVSTKLDANDPNAGVCLLPSQAAALEEENGSVVDRLGARPPCWYNQVEFQ